MQFYSFIHDSNTLAKISEDSFLKYGELKAVQDNIDISSLRPADVLIINLDPFTLKKFSLDKIKKIPSKKVAIICDTHHGLLPISRHIHFCLNSGIKDIILRFNQRHKPIFEEFGFNVCCPLFSPDILKKFKYSSIKFQTSDIKRKPKVVSIGRISGFHRYRQLILRQVMSNTLINKDIELKSTDSLDKMYNCMSDYQYALNVSLNMDFNRRLLEMLVAGCIPISDQLEKSQFLGTFHYFESGIVWYRNIHELVHILTNKHLYYDIFLEKTRDLQYKIVNLAIEGHDQRMREQMIDSLVNHVPFSSINRKSHIFTNYLDLFEYELILDLSNRLKLNSPFISNRYFLPRYIKDLISVYNDRGLSQTLL